MSSGSVFQRKDGRWVAALTVNGKRKLVYAKSQAEARRRLAELQQEVGRTGIIARPGKRTVNDLLDVWLDTAQLRVTTRTGYEKVLRTHVRSVLGGMRLARLSPDHLQKLYSRLDGKRTPSKVHRILHRALAQAVLWGWLATNPADRVAAPTYTAARRTLWTEAQLQRFLDASATHRYAPLWVLALASGLRQGELLGLQWADLDLEHGVLAVRRTLHRIKGQLVTQPPKTRAGERVMTLPPSTVQVLRHWRSVQAAERLAAAGQWAAEDWVFTNAAGDPLPDQTIIHALRDLCVRQGLPNIGHHGLRHLHATLLLAQGLPVPAVSARLGHANPQITMSVYAHALPAQDQQSADAIGRALAVQAGPRSGDLPGEAS